MAKPLPTNPPWEWPFRPISRSRLIVVANSDVSWSVTLAQEYCTKRGIPTLLTAPMGNGGSSSTYSQSWTPAGDMTTVNTVLMAPLKALCLSLGAQGVLLAPGVPILLYALDKTGVLDYGVLTSLVASVLRFPPTGHPISDITPSLGGWGFQHSPGNYVGWAGGGVLSINFNGSTTTNTNSQWAIDYTAPSIFSPIALPTELATETLGEAGHYNTTGLYADLYGYPQLPVGRIGMSSYGGGFGGQPPVAETEAVARTLLAQADGAFAQHDFDRALTQPMLFNLTDQDGGIDSQSNWAYLSWLARDWGINVRYGYFHATPSTYAQTYAPLSGAAYTNTEMLAGTVREPFYLMCGGWDNVNGGAPGAFYTPPWSEAWQPLPGAVAFMGPSNGFQCAMWQLYRGGAGALTDAWHINNLTLSMQFTYWHCLLRGMTQLEALWYSGYATGSFIVGDPLWAPYAQQPPGDGPLNPDATPYQGRANTDARTGFKVKRGELRREWTGTLTLNPERRHPQELAPPREPEQPHGSRAPEGPDTFV